MGIKENTNTNTNTNTNNRKNKNKNTNTNKQQNTQAKEDNVYPFVSICTPTFNRRPFIPFLIKCFQHQDYPKDRMEWIIIDDGTDTIEDLVKDIPQVLYYHFQGPLLLGNKRNIMHSKCRGDIIVYMDDDDYYPPTRVSHAVKTLLANPTYLIAGSSEMHIYFHDLNKMYKCGPYAENHSTAASFAFKKELLNMTRYDDTKALAEESEFLKKYTIPLKQLNVLDTILVFAHSHNSFDKKQLLKNPQETKVTPSSFQVTDFIKEEDIMHFYTKELHEKLPYYDPGNTKYKPHVLNQIAELQESRNKRMEEHLKNKDTTSLKMHYEKQISDKNYLINELLKRIKELEQKLKG